MLFRIHLSWSLTSSR